MRKYYLFFIALMLVASVVNAADRYSVATGNWNSAGTWSATSGGASGATAPVAGDNVFIEGGFTVTITADAACANLTVGTTTAGILNIGNSAGDDLTVSGSISIASGSSISATDDGLVTLGGNLTNNGVFDLNVGGSDHNMLFNGSANQTLSGTGTTNDFNTITVNNTGAANNNIVDITSTNFTATAGFLVLTDGFFRLSTGVTIAPDAGTFDIPTGTGFILNHASAVVNNTSGSVAVDGTLSVIDGTLNVGGG